VNQTTLKNFAQEARRELLKQVALRLNYWIGGEGAKSRVDSAEHRQFAPQVKELEVAAKQEGREALIERVAYTWFNRLAALRFMDANGYHPFGAKVIMPATANDTLPELLQQARAGTVDPDLRACFGNAKAFDDLLAGKIPVPHLETAVYRALLVAACNYYQRLMPFMFEKIGDATELLLPEDLLTEHSILHAFRTELADDDCRDVEVIGWLYQYYISDKKDEVMGRNAAVPKEDIPAVTQLFTPHWIVRYLVENSLGRLWLLNRPNSRLREKMPYYIDGDPEAEFLKIGTPEEIRLCDPACGSGHMLTYAYDLLYAIYAEEGYDEKDIPGLILKHNLYGVEICDRAAALAAFALCMKARSSDSRFFRRVVQPNVIALQDVRFDEGELSAYFRAIGSQPSGLHPALLELLRQFDEARNFGSLIHPCVDTQAIAIVRRAIETKNLGGQLFLRDTHLKVLRVLEQANALTERYHVVVANPPYMGSKAMNPRLKSFVEEHLNGGKSDLFGAFTLRNLNSTLDSGFIGMITIPNWMFLESFEDLRKQLLDQSAISTLIHNGRGLWGADFGSCAFILHKTHMGVGQGSYKRLFSKPSEVNSPEVIEARFLDDQNFPWMLANTKEFKSIPGYPIAYWISPKVRLAFSVGSPLSQFGDARQGLATADNNRFLRFWFEPSSNRIRLRCRNREEARTSGARWFPYNKGGAYRKWYGNSEHVIDWANDGEVLFGLRPKSVIRSPDKYFQPSLSWSKVTIGAVSFRAFDEGYLFDVAGCSFFPNQQIAAKVVAGYLNSPVVRVILGVLSPTMNYEVGHISKLPVLDKRIEEIAVAVTNLVSDAITSARADWDNFETSWDFREFPLLRFGQWTVDGGRPGGSWKGAALEESWNNWKCYCDAAIRRMQELETENNRLFIDAYGLQDELKPEVPEDQITLARADAHKDVAAFVSYAVGCMFGRYSLDAPGLILADAGATVADYLARLPKPTFAPDSDGILPVLDGEWFADDIVARFREFLKVTFGEETLEANLAFIETSLGKDLRKYFVRDFYKNHLSNERAYGYKKRPIYWMVSSPEGSFQALIYLHRYTRDTMNLLLNDYVREFAHKLEERQRQLTAIRLNEAARTGDRTKAVKELGKIEKMLKELREWERDILLPFAQQRVEINLDDGVKVNYLKFKGVLVPIPGLEKKDEE